PGSEISLLDIIEAVEGPIAPVPVEGSQGPLQCRLNDAMCGINEVVSRELAAIKISDLLDPIPSGDPQVVMNN
ncbi:MAG TPA: Rrf2 family transcriptional regulator, partial [Pirellulales bacterium]|nr:Rrf2 family transcriptional regulator [Pirellulales bacterium]